MPIIFSFSNWNYEKIGKVESDLDLKDVSFFFLKKNTLRELHVYSTFKRMLQGFSISRVETKC